MVWLALGGILLVFLLLSLNAFAHARVEQIRKLLVWSAAGVGVIGLVVLLWSGRGFQALFSLSLIAPLLVRMWQSWRAARRFAQGGQPSPGGGSAVETATLAMMLDHASGRMTGTVRRGRFAGTDLADLTQEQLIELRDDCAVEDAESVPLLEAWLDRAHPDWRDAPRAEAAPSSGAMTRAEAAQILGVEENASEEDIQAAYRRLMRAAHPDQGGSAWMAARLNAARDFLLGR